MNILTYTTLYPNLIQKRHGIFVENRLRHLADNSNVNITVIAPVPWFPSKNRRFGMYSQFAKVPAEEERYGIKIYHPRYPVIPKIGMNISPELMFHFTKKAVKKIIGLLGKIDLIDAHYLYPDGVAAANLGRWLGLPVVMTARGSDVTLLPSYKIPNEKILTAINETSATITVCKALKQELIKLGADRNKITVLRNGVNLDLFKSSNREIARQKLKITRCTLLSIGNLIELKGHHLVIEALEKIDADLLIIGEGEEEERLKVLVTAKGLESRVRFLGLKIQTELPEIYSAVDALVLASSREGLANVLLESMACGTPVIATPLWGTPEVVAVPEAGVLMRDRSSDAIIEAYNRLFEKYPNRHATRKYAEKFSWDETTEGQIQLFRRVINRA